MASKADEYNREHYDRNSCNKWCIMGETFELPDQFRVTDYLGAGAYGVVCSAWDVSGKISHIC